MQLVVNSSLKLIFLALCLVAAFCIFPYSGKASYCDSPSLKEKTESAELIVEGKVSSVRQDGSGYIAAVVSVDHIIKGHTVKKELIIYALPVWDKDRKVAGFLGRKAGEKPIPGFLPTGENGVEINNPNRFYLTKHKKIAGAYLPIYCNTSESLLKDP